MTKKKYNCFESYEFFGEFFPSYDSNDGRFAGKIKYSPENGLQLEYCLSNSAAPTKCDKLFGFLNNGKKCTLVGQFDFDRGTHYLGDVTVKSGLHGFYYLLIGAFVNDISNVKFANFTFNGMQEFIHPQGFISQLKYQDEPILTTKGNDWLIEVRNNATYSVVGDDIINLIHTRDDEAQEKLKLSLEKIKGEHPKLYFTLRKTFQYTFKYKSVLALNTDETLQNIIKIAALFSILMARPKFPDEIEFYFDNEDSVQVLNSMCLERRTIKLAQQDISHMLMPLNWKQIDMESALSRWFDLYDDFQVLSVSHQYETGFKTLHYAHSDIILYSTQLEAINADLGGKTGEKYTRPIETYASPELILSLKKVFSKINEEELGKNISNLRNELAHVGRPKVMMKKLSIDDYVDVGIIFQLVVVSHLLAKLGVSTKYIYHYQNRLIPLDDS